MPTKKPHAGVDLGGDKERVILVRDSASDNPIDTISLASMGVFMLYEDITETSAKELCEFLVKANYVFSADTCLTLMINSFGGSAYDGWGIIDTMECGRLPIQTVAVGSVMSMAAVIFVTGTRGRRIMTHNSYMMTHQFSSVLESKYHEFVAERSHLDDLHERFVRHFVQRSKMTVKQVKEILLGKSDTYLDAKECKKFGLCDIIKDPWEGRK